MPPISDLTVLHCENVGDLYLHLLDVSTISTLLVAQRPVETSDNN